MGRWQAPKEHPRLGKHISGTVAISAVDMFGKAASLGIPPVTTTALMLTVGGIGEQQMAVGRHTAVREGLSLTISFDHGMVDSVLAAHFIRRLKELIESGYGLRDAIAPIVASVESARAGGA